MSKALLWRWLKEHAWKVCKRESSYMYFVYVLKSLKDNKYYYGSTDNLENRLKRHNQGYVRSTKSRRPLELIHKEEFATRADAYRRELYFKSIDGYIWLVNNGVITKK